MRLIFKRQAWYLWGFTFINLKLKFYPKVLYRLYDDFDDEMIVRNSDGTCTLEVQFPEDEWVYGYLLSFGNYVEVLEPQHVRDIIIDRARQLLKFYENSI